MILQQHYYRRIGNRCYQSLRSINQHSESDSIFTSQLVQSSLTNTVTRQHLRSFYINTIIQGYYVDFVTNKKMTKWLIQHNTVSKNLVAREAFHSCIKFNKNFLINQMFSDQVTTTWRNICFNITSKDRLESWFMSNLHTFTQF